MQLDGIFEVPGGGEHDDKPMCPDETVCQAPAAASSSMMSINLRAAVALLPERDSIAAR